jgi:DNA-binding response OmpR family regulator
MVISGFGGESYAIGTSELRADKVLEKPFNPLELLKAVEDLLP